MTQVSLYISSDNVGAALSDFPVYIPLSRLETKSGGNFWNEVTANGGDIRAYDADDNQLSVDVVLINTGTETGFLYVRLEDIAASGDTEIKIEWDGTSTAIPAGDPFGPYSVWTGWTVVYIPEGGDYNRVDGTSATTVGTISDPGGQPAGWLAMQNSGGYKKFTGVSYTTVWSFFAVAQVISTSSTNDNVLGLDVDGATNDTNRVAVAFRNNDNFAMWDTANNWLEGGDPTAATPTALSGFYNGTTARVLYYRDALGENGTLTDNTTTAKPTNSSATTLYIGASNDATTTSRMDGAIRMIFYRQDVQSAEYYRSLNLNVMDSDTFLDDNSDLPFARVAQFGLMILGQATSFTQVAQLGVLALGRPPVRRTIGITH